MKIILVACVGQKLGYPAPARDLYQSTWFKRARAYAEQFGDRWYILSAKYGLLNPEQVIQPYDLTLADLRPNHRQAWANDIKWKLFPIVYETDPPATLTFLAGKLYRLWLVKWFRDAIQCEIPMAGLGIGQQIKWLSEQVERKTYETQLTASSSSPQS